MLKVLASTVSGLGTAVTVAAVLFFSTPRPGSIVQSLLLLLLTLAVVVVVMEWTMYFRRIPDRYEPNSDSIAAFMCSWLGSGGRSAVFSRDLSWVGEDGPARAILDRKAKAGELLLFVGRRTNLIGQLAAAGASVHDYSSLPFTPKSRFTIVDVDKAGSRMAIGLVHEGKHVIWKFGTDDHAVMALATDLVDLARLTSPPLK